MMKIRAGDGWTVVCLKIKKVTSGRFFNTALCWTLVRMKEKRKGLERREGTKKKHTCLMKKEVCALAQSCRVLKRLFF